MTSLFPPFNRRSSFRKQPYFYEAGRGVNYKSTGGPFPTLDLNFLSGTLDPRITFSRASNATLTDSTGKITYAPNNLALYSQSFSSWTADGANVTSSTETAPDGTATAALLTAASGNNRRYQTTTFTVGVPYVFSIYVKQGTAATVQTDLINQVAGPIFTFSNLTYTGGVGVTNHTVTSVGNGWYRLSFKLTPTVASIGPGIAMNGASVGQTVYVWGQQAEAVTYQTTPSTYNATTTAAYYGPRFDYDPVTLSAKGLLIEEARTNSLLQSENFAASWSLLRMTVSADATTSPSGTTTADQLLDTAVAGTHVAIQTITKAASSLAYTASVYLKANVRTLGELRMSDQSGNGVRNTFNLSAGTIGSPSTFGTGFAATGSTITNVGNGWYRVDVSCTTNTATTLGHEVYIADAGGNTSYTGNGSGFYAWGAQLEAGAFATSYIPTAAASVARSADIATMTGTNFSSWFNQGPVNLQTYSEEFDNAAWTKSNATITANATTAPNGTLTADKLVENTSTVNDHRITSVATSFTVGQVYTTSIYLKAAERSFARFFVVAVSPNPSFTVDLSNGSITWQGNQGTSIASATAVGNGWYRVSVSFTPTQASASAFYFTIAYSSSGTISGFGDGTSGIFVWGAQLEVGSTATTYIPTTTVPVASPPAVGTFVASVSLLAAPSVRTACLYAVSDNTTSQRILAQTGAGSGGNINTLVAVGGVTQAQTINGSLASAGVYKYANAFATDDFSSAANGGAAVTDTSGTVPAVNRFEIGSSGIQTAQLCGTIASVKYYPTRLPNTQLVSLTQPSLTPSMQLVFDTSSTSFTDANWSP